MTFFGQISRRKSDRSPLKVKQEIIKRSGDFQAALKAYWAANEDTDALKIVEQSKSAVVALIQELSLLNNEKDPYAGWKQCSSGCPINGTWDVIFSTSSDTNIRPSAPLGAVVIQQKVDADSGLFLNELNYPDSTGLLRKCSIFIDGDAYTVKKGQQMQLSFNRVQFSISSPLLEKITLPLPRLRFLNPYFITLYVDKEMRAQVTNSGEYYVFQRIK